MRRLVLATAMFGMVFGAQAADMPDLPILRGSLAPTLSATSRNWDGWYAGGHVSYTSAEMDFSHSVKSLTNFILRNSVLRLEAGRDRCRDCHRSPLVGERMFVYASGRAVCELCRALRPEEPAEVHLVRATQSGHTVLRVTRAA